jgi:hypothetical protein
LLDAFLAIRGRQPDPAFLDPDEGDDAMITVTISKAALRRARACSDGLKLFDELKAMYDAQRAADGKPARKGITVTWTRLHALWLATAHPWAASWLRDEGIVPAISFNGANLDGANLVRANLDGANLEPLRREPRTSARTLDGANLVRRYGANLEPLRREPRRREPLRREPRRREPSTARTSTARTSTARRREPRRREPLRREP